DPQLDPLHSGYFRDSDGMKPTTTEVLPAPKANIEMVQCRLSLEGQMEARQGLTSLDCH
ncbi:hypothetical protein JOQ06_028299, partial [Pogonophryne albipinna]